MKPPFNFQRIDVRRIKVGTMHPTRWILAYLLMLLIYGLPELLLCASVAESKVKHEGFCPNKLNSNLWVDAQSTCERECNVDEVELLVLSSLFLHSQ